MNSYLYFQPQYVNRFRCDGSKCKAQCCKNWRIIVDDATYQKYSRLGSQITKHIDASKQSYRMLFDDKNICPFLNADNLCRLQLDYGEDFLSATCATYPRYTRDFGDFFERSLTLSCPVAADLILSDREPMQFELVEVSDKIHSLGGKIGMAHVDCTEGLAPRMLETQIAMISILQERTLTIDQRLIVLGFFLDRLEKISTNGLDVDALLKLIDAYESKTFLARNFPSLLRTVRFDARKFIGLMINLLNVTCNNLGAELLSAVKDALQIEGNRVSISQLAARYQSLRSERNTFLRRHSIALENYLVNELFRHCYPWRLKRSVSDNFALFATVYKILELILFATTLRRDDKQSLLQTVSYFAERIDHSEPLQLNIMKHIPRADNTFVLMDTLFAP